MIGFKNDKKLVKRPDDEPKFNKHNPVDRKILLLVLLGAGLVLLLAIGFIILYFTMWY